MLGLQKLERFPDSGGCGPPRATGEGPAAAAVASASAAAPAAASSTACAPTLLRLPFWARYRSLGSPPLPSLRVDDLVGLFELFVDDVLGGGGGGGLGSDTRGAGNGSSRSSSAARGGAELASSAADRAPAGRVILPEMGGSGLVPLLHHVHSQMYFLGLRVPARLCRHGAAGAGRGGDGGEDQGDDDDDDEGCPLALDFVGKLEALDDHYPRMLARLAQLAPSKKDRAVLQLALRSHTAGSGAGGMSGGAQSSSGGGSGGSGGDASGISDSRSGSSGGGSGGSGGSSSRGNGARDSGVTGGAGGGGVDGHGSHRRGATALLDPLAHRFVDLGGQRFEQALGDPRRLPHRTFSAIKAYYAQVTLFLSARCIYYDRSATVRLPQLYSPVDTNL